MLLIDSLAEEKIRAAIRSGEMDDLPGQGQPLRLDDDSAVPAELRTAYRLLKNSGFLPPQVSLRREIAQVEQLLLQIETEFEAEPVRKRLRLLQLRLSLHGRETSLLVEAGNYRDKLLRKLGAVAG